MAMRTPVKLPGPSVAAIRSRSRAAMQAAASTSATIGISASAWPRAIASCRACKLDAAPSVRNTAAEQAPMLVSRARMFMRASLNYSRHLVEIESRRAGEQDAPVAIAETAQEIGLDARAGKKFAVDARIVEARHRPAIEAERPRRHDQISALQCAV